MTPDEIREVFDGFIEFPHGVEKLYVTTASTLIFAQHVAKIAAEREREACAKVCVGISNEAVACSIKHSGNRDKTLAFFNNSCAAEACADAIRARSTP